MGFVEPLVTDRLVLRPWRVEDAAEALGIYGHPDVARWLSPEMDHVPDLAAMRLLLQQWVAEDARTPAPAGRWAIDRRDDGRDPHPAQLLVVGSRGRGSRRRGRGRGRRVGGWVVGGAAVVEQGAGERVGDQAARDSVGGDLAGQRGGDGAVADEFGGLVSSAPINVEYEMTIWMSGLAGVTGWIGRPAPAPAGWTPHAALDP